MLRRAGILAFSLLLASPAIAGAQFVGNYLSYDEAQAAVRAAVGNPAATIGYIPIGNPAGLPNMTPDQLNGCLPSFFTSNTVGVFARYHSDSDTTFCAAQVSTLPPDPEPTTPEPTGGNTGGGGTGAGSSTGVPIVDIPNSSSDIASGATKINVNIPEGAAAVVVKTTDGGFFYVRRVGSK